MEYGFTDILRLIGSLALFLFGMKVMSDALLNLAGNRMRSILAKMTSNRFLGVFTGFLITSVIQSSSATTLMIVSFSNAGLLTLTESIGVIMGANIGTTITAWLITILGFKVSMSAMALPLVGLGFALTFSKKERAKNLGTFIVGFALIFIGLQFLKEAMPNIQSNPQILSFIANYTDLGYLSVLIFLLIGTVLTVIVQSSSATMALTLVMCAQGWISFEMAAAMVLGENIGTTITANLAAIVGNFRAKQTARAHFLFNIFGVIWMLILFYPFLKFVAWLGVQMGNESPYITAAAIPVAVSLFHTTFNICNTFVLIGFVGPMAHLVKRMVPDKTETEPAINEPKYLTDSVLQYPETAIESLHKESKQLFKGAIFEIVAHTMKIHRSAIKSEVKLSEIVKEQNEELNADIGNMYLSKVKNIFGKILQYATITQNKFKLSNKQSKTIEELKVANRRMVEIVKIAEDINKNVSAALTGDNLNLREEYDKYRKKIAKVLRVIYRFRKGDETEANKQHIKLIELKKEAKENIKTGNKTIDQLIRKNNISVDMASSLFNDYSNINDIIRKLIQVAELLYAEQDTLEL